MDVCGRSDFRVAGWMGAGHWSVVVGMPRCVYQQAVAVSVHSAAAALIDPS